MFPEPPGGAIVLAAGSSSRLGQPKQLVRFEGQSLLRRTALMAIESGAFPVIVVLGQGAARFSPELDGLSVAIAENPAWAEGMASSLRLGLAQLQHDSPNAAAAMLLVCDQPLLRAVHLQTLWQQQFITGVAVAAEYSGRAGVPAIFPARYFSQLSALQGDQGARALLRQMPASDLVTFPLPEAGADLDTPEDLAVFHPQISRKVEDP